MEIYKLSEEHFHSEELEKEQFAIDVLMGLCSKPKKIPAKYFYDDKGSELFQKITHHQDYYPTKIEYQILESIKDQLASFIDGDTIDIIELGVGDGHKSELIIEGFLNAGKRVNFYPIDISKKAMKLLEETLNPHDHLKIKGVIGEYFEGLQFLRDKSTNPQLVLFLGSNIGNFDQIQNQGFLRRLWKVLNDGDHVLIGFDLKKDINVLTKAYNDSAGLTTKFNLNLLHRMNNELGADFETKNFQHLGFYNPNLGAMESYLLSTKDQKVYIKELERFFHFKEFESLHLEYSFKFLKSDVDFLSSQTGFKVIHHFTDEKNYFLDSLWKVSKSIPQ